MAKDAPKFAQDVDIKIEKRAEVLYARVKPSTKEWFDAETQRSGARSVGEYIDALVERLRRGER